MTGPDATIEAMTNGRSLGKRFFLEYRQYEMPALKVDSSISW
jgi:hypothetical protein